MSRIVMIEDNMENARLASKLLSRAGHQVEVAGEGESGLEMVNHAAPDMVLVDLGLPDMDGQRVIAIIRQNPDLQGLPIVVVSAWSEEQVRSIAQEYGCDGVIIKPIDTRRFAQEINNYLDARRKL